MSEREQFLAMLESSSTTHETYEDEDTGGITVVVQNDDGGGSEWSFNTRGKLIAVLSLDS